MRELQVGDMVYQYDTAGNIYTLTICKISGGGDEPMIYDCGYGNIAFDNNAIGTSVFLTKKDAENAFKRYFDNL